MRHRIEIVVCMGAMSVVFGCGKAPPPGERAAAAAPIADEAARRGDGRAALARLIAGTRPAPLAALTKVRLGMPRAEAMEVAPEFFTSADGDYDTDVAPGLLAALYIDSDSDLVESLLFISRFDMRPQLVAAWGEPTYHYDHTFTEDTYRADGDHAMWFDGSSGWAAIGEATGLGYSLEFVPAQPLAALLGPAKDRLAFEGDHSIIGRGVDEICQAFPRDCAARLAAAKSFKARRPQDPQEISDEDRLPFTLELPITEWAADPPTVRLEWSGTTVRGYRVSFDTSRPGSREAILDAAKRHWRDPEARGEALVLHEEPLIYVIDDNPEWSTVAIYVGLPIDE